MGQSTPIGPVDSAGNELMSQNFPFGGPLSDGNEAQTETSGWALNITADYATHVCEGSSIGVFVYDMIGSGDLVDRLEDAWIWFWVGGGVQHI